MLNLGPKPGVGTRETKQRDEIKRANVQQGKTKLVLETIKKRDTRNTRQSRCMNQTRVQTLTNLHSYSIHKAIGIPT